KSS
ncbi:pepSY-associated TM helix family protein, partial [Vibrio parahaemolyticus V-223/04]